MDREVRIAFLAKTASFTRDMKDMYDKIKELQNRISKVFDPIVKIAKNVGRTMIGFSSTVGAGLGLASKSAIEFEKSMRNVNSILGLAPAGFAKLEQDILHLAGTVPKTADDLAQASYQIVSSGFTNAADLNLILASSAKAATAGLTSTETAAKGITTVLQSYGLTAKDSAHVSDVLFQTVNVGMVNFEQLTQQMGDFLGISKSVGISLEESMGLYASLTLATGQYAQSATAMTGIMQGFINPSTEMNQALKFIAPNGIKAAIQTKGLTKVLYELSDAVHGDAESLHNFFPNVEGLRGVLALTRKPLQDTQTSLEKFLNPMKLGGATTKVFKEQMKAVGNQMTQLHTAFGAAAISIGTVLMPFGFVVQGLTKMINVFNALPDPLKQMTGLILAFGSILGTVGGFILVFQAKTILMGKAMKFLGLEARSLTELAIKKLGSEFTSKAKVIDVASGAASKATGLFARLGTAGIPRATQAIAGLGSKIPVVGTQVSNLTTLMGTRLGNAVGMVTSKSAGMSTGFAKIGSIVTKTATVITKSRDGIYKLITILPKLGAYAVAAFTAFEAAKGLGDWLHHDAEKAKEFAIAMADAAKIDMQPPAKEIRSLAQSIKDSGLRDPGLVKSIYGFSDVFSRMAGPLEGGGAKAREAVTKIGVALKGLFDLDPASAAKEYQVYTEALLRAGVSQKDLDIVFKDYKLAVKEAGIATGAVVEPITEVDKAAQALAKHTMELTAAQEKVKTGIGTWGDLSSVLTETKTKLSDAKTYTRELADATARDTETTKSNTKAHEEWVAGAERRNIAIEQSTISVTRATWAVTDAQKAYDEVLADDGHVKRMKTAEDAYSAALKANGDAHQRVIDATKALDELRHPTPRTLQFAEDQYTKALNAEADAKDAVVVAQARYDEAIAEGDPDLIAKMGRELANAKIDERDATWATADALKVYNDVQAGGSPEDVAKLTQDVTDAKAEEVNTTDDLADADKNRNDVAKEDRSRILTDAALTLTDAQLGLRSAIDGHTQALQDNIEKEPEAATAVHDFKQKTDDAKVSASDFTAQLKADQIEQDKWLANIQKIAEKGPPGLAAALIQMGKDGATVVADLVDKTPAQLATMFDTMNTNAVTKTNEWAVAVLAGLTTGKNSAATVTEEMKNNIAFQLGISVGDVQRILDGFGTGITPVLQGVKGLLTDIGTWKTSADFKQFFEVYLPGLAQWVAPGAGGLLGGGNPLDPQRVNPYGAGPQPAPPPPTGLLTTTPGNLSPVIKRAAGSFEDHTAQIAAAGSWRMWAEPETGGEAYIPLAMSKRNRSMDILGQVAEHFGAQLYQFADGGMSMATGKMVSAEPISDNKPIHVEMPIHVEARVAAGVDMDYASRVIAQQVEAGVKLALDNLGRQVIAKSWRR